MFTESMDSCGSVALHCASLPPGPPPLLMLHGVMRCWNDFVTLATGLSLRWQIHALDFRGHGKSDRADRYLVLDYAADVVAYLKKAVETPVVLYGHSLGALVAAAVASNFPEGVRGVVLEDPPGPLFLREMHQTPYGKLFEAMRAFAGDPRPLGDLAKALGEIPVGDMKLSDLRDATALRFSASCLRQLDPNVLTPLIEGRWLEGYDVPEVFGKIRCPVLLLRADDAVGGMLPAGEARQLTSYLNEGVMVEIPNVGHLLHLLAPETVLRLTSGFLESL